MFAGSYYMIQREHSGRQKDVIPGTMLTTGNKAEV
jgi:hypothetical protein